MPIDQISVLGEDFWAILLCNGGSRIDAVTVHAAHDGSRVPFRWYPRTLLKQLVLVSGPIFLVSPKNVLLHHFFSQNAWQTERPGEFVKTIRLTIPPGADVEDPTADAALLARIGATRNDEGGAEEEYPEYELKNAEYTGTRFTFFFLHSNCWTLTREEAF